MTVASPPARSMSRSTPRPTCMSTSSGLRMRLYREMTWTAAPSVAQLNTARKYGSVKSARTARASAIPMSGSSLTFRIARHSSKYAGTCSVAPRPANRPGGSPARASTSPGVTPHDRSAGSSPTGTLHLVGDGITSARADSQDEQEPDQVVGRDRHENPGLRLGGGEHAWNGKPNHPVDGRA